jgi:hypothetical protein
MTQALAISAFLFSIVSFLMATGTLVYLLARRFSTVEQVPVPSGETVYQYDLPPKITTGEDGAPVVTPRPPVSYTEEQYEKQKRLAALEAAYEQEAADLDF